MPVSLFSFLFIRHSQKVYSKVWNHSLRQTEKYDMMGKINQ